MFSAHFRQRFLAHFASSPASSAHNRKSTAKSRGQRQITKQPLSNYSLHLLELAKTEFSQKFLEKFQPSKKTLSHNPMLGMRIFVKSLYDTAQD